jgi:WhiB family redox-sensing transcriptional regulator
VDTSYLRAGARGVTDRTATGLEGSLMEHTDAGVRVTPPLSLLRAGADEDAPGQVPAETARPADHVASGHDQAVSPPTAPLAPRPGVPGMPRPPAPRVVTDLSARAEPRVADEAVGRAEDDDLDEDDDAADDDLGVVAAVAGDASPDGLAAGDAGRSTLAEVIDIGLGDLLGEVMEWQERALCAQTDPEAFFPEKGGSTREAKRICSGCEVRNECLEYALANDERFGIWGGMSERERRKQRRRAV